MNKGRASDDGEQQRAVSPLVGLILLFGIVAIGTALLLVAGSAMLDSIESGAEQEKVHMCMDETDHRLGTVITTGAEQSLAFDDSDCQPQIAADGTISVARHDGEHPDWDDDDRTATETLGTLEFELDEQTIAHQGGAVWERTDSDTRAVKEPNIGFENDTLHVELMQIEIDDVSGGETVVRHDHEGASEATSNLSSVLSDAENNVTFKIESEYADGWERHLRQEKESVSQYSVEVKRDSDDEVEMTIEGIGDPPAEPHFVIDEDHGLVAHDQEEPNAIENNRVGLNDRFYINASLTNYGSNPGTVNATLSIWNDSERNDRTIESNHSIYENNTIKTGPSGDWTNVTDPQDQDQQQYYFEPESLGLEPYTEYEYDIVTDPGGDSLDERGKFIVEEESPEVNISITEIEDDDPVGQGETLTVHADVEKRGYGDGQLVWLNGFGDNTVDTTMIDPDGDGDESVTLEWGSVDLPEEPDQTEISVSSENSTETADVDVEPLLNITAIDVLDEPVEEGDTVEIEAHIEAIGDDTQSDVVLDGFDGSEGDRTQSETISATGSPTTVQLEYEGVGERTDRVTVRTESPGAEDDEMDEVVVVERDGPVCSEVDYEGSGEEGDPYNVSTVDQLQCINDDLDANYQLVDDIDAHGTEYWNKEIVGTERIDSETVTAESGDFGWGDEITLSESPVVEESIEVDAGPGLFNSDPNFELVSAEDGIIEIRDSPGDWDDWSELDVTYETATQFGNPHGFEPIGQDGNNYPNTFVDSNWDGDAFSGDFDGNGHEIRNLYIDRPDERFVGLFGATNYPAEDASVGWGSTIENVRLTDVYVHGQQHVGALAGQAGGTVENARSEGYVEAEEQLVGGLIGDGAHANIDNRLVTEGTVVGGEIAASGNARLNHEGIGGLVGRATWETQVSTAYTQTDVSGANYVGSIVGTSSYVPSEFEQMYTTGTATGSDSDAGAIVGHVLSAGDSFDSSVYWDETIESDPYGEIGNWYTGSIGSWTIETDWIGRTTAEMQGFDVTEPDRMGNLEFADEGGPWEAVPDDYPRFSWELEAEGIFEVEIDDVDNVTAGNTSTVDVTVTSRDRDQEEKVVTQTITLTNMDGQVVDTKDVDLTSYPDRDDSETIELEWHTSLDDEGVGEVTAQSEDREDSAPIEIDPADIEDLTGDVDPDDLDDFPFETDLDGVEIG
ncbi:DUF7289 family protein [Halobiforma nitratireducens]|uniref:GLUG domain-containing protein n=1 Tax=Halobiforma nitratireducens JCM 10879 TaxID=1227454 RepID=M0LRX6_9EURY|nr:hypothetical protein [Halobiforma nitratireducens]EMA36332.1 hypothetical protein C446_11762 [Halobiforma nitratireducens JCM 10879]